MNAQPREQIPLDLIEPEAPTLDNFVQGDNGELLAALRQCAQYRGTQFIYFWGPAGSGRSHLLRALTPCQRRRVPEFDPSLRIYTVDNVELLDAEDLERLFVLMNCVRANPDTRLVVAGGLTLGQLTLREDIKSRLSWGLVFGLRYLNDRAARDEFIRLAYERGIEISPELSEWIANYCPRDMRSLRSMLDKIDRYAMERKRRVTLPLVQQWINEQTMKKNNEKKQ